VASAMKPVLLLQPGEKLATLDGIPGDFADWIRTGMGVDNADARVIYPHLEQALPAPHAYRAVVVSGSSAMVTDHQPWIERLADWLRHAALAGIPTLGICFGHQLLAYALGGLVANNPRGTEAGTVPVKLTMAGTGNPLFRGVPAQVHLHVSHRQTVSCLPPGAQRLAHSELEGNQAFVANGSAWGIQFHPEFTTPVICGYLDYHSDHLRARGGDPVALQRNIQETPFGRVILSNFSALAQAAG